ncbi:hypothetical protein [Shimia abyssi]|nr:hypothetical protein [Shimia abyssi]
MERRPVTWRDIALISSAFPDPNSGGDGLAETQHRQLRTVFKFQ